MKGRADPASWRVALDLPSSHASMHATVRDWLQDRMRHSQGQASCGSHRAYGPCANCAWNSGTLVHDGSRSHSTNFFDCSIKQAVSVA